MLGSSRKVYIVPYYYITMKTTVGIDKETLKSLNLMKYAMGVTTLDEVITTLLINYQVKKLKEERQASEVVEAKEERKNPFIRR